MDLVNEGFSPLRFVQERVSPTARHIRIEVRPNGEVRLIIPRYVSRRAAYDFLASRSEWIQRKLREFDTLRAAAPAPLQLRWDGTDSLRLRGIDTPLMVSAARIARPAVRIETEAVTVFCSASTRRDPTILTRTLRAALCRLARGDARRLLELEAPRIGVDFTGPRIADQKSLWGSCSPDGLISLNWRLVMAPREVLRYVVVHELCHRRHLNHSQRFWNLVERQMPDYGTWRAWLRTHGAELHRLLPRGDGSGGQLDLLTDAV
jgi:predicted metal-dependent hydrolase